MFYPGPVLRPESDGVYSEPPLHVSQTKKAAAAKGPDDVFKDIVRAKMQAGCN